MELITDEIRAALLRNDAAEGGAYPVAKLYNAGCTLLLVAAKADNPDFVVALGDFGNGVFLTTVRLSEISNWQPPLRRDVGFVATKPFSAYIVDGRHAGRIVT